jgi:acyl-CoA synthetase (AMP-forming)/AMP-acid ligase II
VAYTFLLDGESHVAELTYEELDRKARDVAALLAAQASPGARALLVYSAGLEFVAAFLGCLYANVVAVPAFLPDSGRGRRTLPRLRAITNDARPGLALTETALLPALDEFLSGEGVHAIPKRLATDRIGDGLEVRALPPRVNPETLAFLQYTSGSTASPKGVMVSHGNLTANARRMCQAFGLTEHSIGVCWLPWYHDMGLVGHVLQTLFVGGRCVLMSPTAFLQKPVRWLRAISRYQATISAAPDFAYDLCVRKIPAEDRAGLDLRSWRVAINGAEPVRPQTLDAFAAAFAPCGFRREAFYPSYGLAEGTLLVTGCRGAAPSTVLPVQRRSLERNRVLVAAGDNEDSRRLVSCGRAADGEVAVVDPTTLRHCPPDQIGEIWVTGPHVAKGYWNRPDETAAVFQASLAGSGGGPFLRTGDLGFLRDGNLFITGRQKDLILVRGANHYPEDIEATVGLSHPTLRPHGGAVFGLDDAGDVRLVVAHEVVRGQERSDLSEVVAAVRRAVAQEHGLQVQVVLLLRAGVLPRTSSGKLQRQACAASYKARTLHALACSDLADQERPALGRPPAVPAGELERLLTDLWQDVMGLKGIGVHDNFFELGGSSIQAAMLANRLQERLGAIVSPVTFFDVPTIALMARYLSDHYAASLAAAGLAAAHFPAHEAGQAPEGGPVLDEGTMARLRGLLRRTSPRDGHAIRSRNPRVIFILGPPRSGTTLLRVMLGGHPRLFAPPELELLPFDTLKERRAFFGGGFEFWLQGATRAVMELKGCDGGAAERFLRDSEKADMPVAELYGLFQKLLGGRTLVDKSPSYALDSGVLERAEQLFDEPLYLYLLRHPHAVIRSFEEAKLHLATPVFFTTPPECSPRQLAEFVWLISHNNIQAFLQKVPAHRQLRVCFERLVTEPQASLEGICHFLRLDLVPDMVNPYQEKQRRMTDGVTDLAPMVGDPKFHRHDDIDPTAADRWRKYEVPDFLGPKTWAMAESLGYVREGPPREQRTPEADGATPGLTSHEAESLLARLDQLSDEQVEALLKVL